MVLSLWSQYMGWYEQCRPDCIDKEFSTHTGFSVPGTFIWHRMLAENMKFDVLTAMLLSIQDIWDIMPCRQDLNLVNLGIFFGSRPALLILCPESILLMRVFVQMYSMNVTEVGSKQG